MKRFVFFAMLVIAFTSVSLFAATVHEAMSPVILVMPTVTKAFVRPAIIVAVPVNRITLPHGNVRPALPRMVFVSPSVAGTVKPALPASH